MTGLATLTVSVGRRALRGIESSFIDINPASNYGADDHPMNKDQRMVIRTPPNLTYPAALAPMVGNYLVRKKGVAAALAMIDAACTVVGYGGRHAGGQDVADPRSIVLSQGGHLGDLIMTLPILRWIRRNRPQIRIGLIVGTWAKPMMEGISELYDACYFADHFLLDRSDRPLLEKITRHRQSWKTAAAEIARDRYDVAIECYPFLPNNIPLLYACDIPVRVGFTSGGFGPLLTHKLTWKHDSRPFLDYPRDLARALFDDVSLDQPFQAYYPAPSKVEGLPQRPYFLVQTGAGNPIREWPEERWIELVRALRAGGATVVLAGAGERERERAARISDASAGVISLCDKLSWDGFVALVAGAAHVVCLESSTSHVAAGFGIPSTVIMPATNDPRQFGPANDKARILTFRTPCAPCFRSHGCEHMACIRQVTSAEAAAAALNSNARTGAQPVIPRVS
jgi:ADP-heptose:LPS heptosyltransferase